MISLHFDLLCGDVTYGRNKCTDPHDLHQAGVHVGQLGTVGQGGQTLTNNGINLLLHLLG